MLYPLFSLHQLIDELTQPAQATAGEAQHDHLPVIQKATTASLAFPLSFMQQAAGAKNSKALQVLVHTCQAGCTSLLDRVTNYINTLKNKDGDYPTHLLSSCQVLEASLLNSLLYLQQHFTAYFNNEQPLPVVYRLQEQQQLTQQLHMLTAQWVSSPIDPDLQAIVMAPLLRFIEGPPTQAYSFQQMNYLRQLVPALGATVNRHSGESVNRTLLDTLVSLNFNDAALLQYIMHYAYKQINNTAMPQDQANQWGLYEKHFGQVCTVGQEALLPGSPSAKDALLSMIQQEIKYLNQQQHSLAAIYGSQPTASAAPKSRVLTNLSVNQVAVLLRLLVDCKIIEHSNQTELFKMVAQAFKTTRSTCIADDSLRNKFYSPESPAIKIVKEYLHQMLTYLNKY